jgi:hypothetical protein
MVAFSILKSTIATFAPAAAKPSANAEQTWPPPPITTAVFPLRENKSFVLILLLMVIS